MAPQGESKYNLSKANDVTFPTVPTSLAADGCLPASEEFETAFPRCPSARKMVTSTAQRRKRGKRRKKGRRAVVTEDVRCTLRIDGDTCNASGKRGSAVGVVISTILNSQNSV